MTVTQRAIAIWALLFCAAAGFLPGCSAGPKAVRFKPKSFETTQPVAARPINDAIAAGVAFLKSSQNPDGSWGTGLQTRGYEIYSTAGSHEAFRDGTTALCVMALREAGETEAHGRGMRYLLNSRTARRESGEVIYNIWAHTYALQLMSRELIIQEDKQVRETADWHLKQLIKYAAYNGGWNYYDFDAKTQQPSMEATSFGTASALIALHDARQAGIAVPDDLIKRATNRLEECRTPGGWFLYGADSRYLLKMPANQMKGAIGRTQSGNDALWLWNSPLVNRQRAVDGLKTFLDNHQWIDMGRKRPYPHEAWYQTSGYYYYFGHFYAARLIERIGADEGKPFAEQLLTHMLPYQESDGSWWDYAMWDYHKPYGTAYAIMTLLRCRATLR